MFYFFFTLLVMAPRYEIQTESKLNLLHLQVSVVILSFANISSNKEFAAQALSSGVGPV